MSSPANAHARPPSIFSANSTRPTKECTSAKSSNTREGLDGKAPTRIRFAAPSTVSVTNSNRSERAGTAWWRPNKIGPRHSRHAIWGVGATGRWGSIAGGTISKTSGGVAEASKTSTERGRNPFCPAGLYNTQIANRKQPLHIGPRGGPIIRSVSGAGRPRVPAFEERARANSRVGWALPTGARIIVVGGAHPTKTQSHFRIAPVSALVAMRAYLAR